MDGLQPDELELLQSAQLDNTDLLLATTANAAQTQADRSYTKAASEILDPLLSLIERYSGVAKFAAQFAPAPAALVVDGINCVITIPSMFLKYQKRVLDRLSQMGKRLFIVNQYYEDLYRDDEYVQESLIRVYIDIIDFCLEAKKLIYNKKGGLKRTTKLAAFSLIQPFDNSELGSLASKFDDHVVNFEETLKGAKRRSNDLAQRDADGAQRGMARQLEDIKNTVLSTQALASKTVDEMNNTKKRDADLTLLIRELKGKISTYRPLFTDRTEMNSSDVNMKMENRMQILGRLDHINVSKDHERRVEKRLHGTGGWLLESEMLREWDQAKDSSDSCSNILCIQGAAGSGKSILASRVIDHFSDIIMKSPEEIAMAFVYCNSDNELKINPAQLLSSILYQLCSQASAEAVDRALMGKYGKKTDNSWTREELGKAIVAISGQFVKCYIFVDGLDECRWLEGRDIDKYSLQGDGFRDFCTTLRKLADRSSVIRLAIFSRPDHDAIEKAFPKPCYHIRVDDGQNDGDIKEYILSVLSGETMLVIGKELLQKAERKLVEGANGAFLWVNLLLSDLELLLRWPEDFEDALDKLPRGLNDIYRIWLSRIEKASRSRKPFQILLWLANAKRPLTRPELREALAIEPGAKALRRMWTDDRGLASECADLIVLHNDCYTLLHSSLRDYLTTSVDLPVYLDLQRTAHQKLGRACIIYLMFDKFRTGPLGTRAEADEMLQTNPFFQYAADYWGHHVREALEDGLYEDVKSLTTCTPVRNLLLQHFHKSLRPVNKYLYPFASNTGPLHLLAVVNLVKTAEKLKTEERSIEISDGLGCLALDYAMLSQSREIALWILDEYKKQQASGRLSTLPVGVFSAPELAARYDQGDVILRLVSVGFNVGQRGKTSDPQPLHVAAARGCQSALKALLDKGVPVDCQDDDRQTALLEAAEGNHKTVIDTLIEANANIHHHGWDDLTALHYASLNGNLKLVQLLLDRGANVEPCSGPKWNHQAPIHLAAEKNHAHVIEMLADPKRKGDINRASVNGYSPLLIAVANGSLESTQILVKLGADCSVSSSSKSSPLHESAKTGNIEIANILITAKSDLLYAEDIDKDTPLHIALYGRKAEMSKMLLVAGAKPDVKNSKQLTPLHLAIINDLLDVAKFLIVESNVDTKDSGSNGRSYLHFAAQFGRTNFVRLLVEEGGVDPGAIDDIGGTALHVAASENQFAFIPELLEVAPHIDLRRPDKWGQSAMHRAALSGGLEILKFLALRDVSRNDPNTDGDLPLHLAASGGHFDCVKYLVDNSNLDKQGLEGMTPLFGAVFSGSVTCVTLLLECQANPNITRKSKQTPLTTALFRGSFSIARLLLDKGADPNSRDEFGKSPLFAAAAQGNREMCDRLLRHGCDGLQPDNQGFTAFAMAVLSSDEAIVESFLRYGQNGCHLKSHAGESVFHYAATAGNISMFRRLVQARRDVHADLELVFAPDMGGVTPLTNAAANGHLVVLEELRELGFNINGIKGSVVTPLFEAIRRGHVRVVASLVEHGADLECTGLKGETPISVAAQCGLSRIFNILWNAGAKPWRLDLFGMSALDYAKRLPAFWDELDDSLKEAHNPLPNIQRSKMTCDAIRRSINRILQLPQNMDNAVALQRLELMIILTDALTTVEADDVENDWLMCMTEIYNLSPTLPYSATQKCGLCGEEPIRQAALYACWHCGRDESSNRCQRCYREWSNGEATRSTKIPAWEMLDDLENDLAVIRRAVAGYIAKGVQVVAAGLDIATPVSEWIKEKQSQFNKWDRDYNSTGRFKKPMPGREFLHIMLDASKLLSEQGGDNQQGETDGSALSEPVNHDLGEAELPATPRPSFKELDKQLEKLFRNNSPHRETAPYECIGHKLYEVPLLIDWAKDHTLHGPFDGKGYLTKDWLEGLLQRYSPDSSPEGHSSVSKQRQHGRHVADTPVEGGMDQATSQPNANRGSATKNLTQTDARTLPIVSSYSPAPQPVRRPTTGADISSIPPTAAASLIPFGRRNMLRDLQDRRLLSKMATFDVLRDETPTPLRSAITFDLRKFEHHEASRVSAREGLFRFGPSSGQTGPRSPTLRTPAASEPGPSSEDPELQRKIGLVNKARQEIREHRAGWKTKFVNQANNIRRALGILHRKKAEAAGPNGSEAPQNLDPQTTTLTRQITQLKKSLEGITADMERNFTVESIGFDAFRAITLGSADPNLANENTWGEFLREEGNIAEEDSQTDEDENIDAPGEHPAEQEGT